jgi:hypothetical protein
VLRDFRDYRDFGPAWGTAQLITAETPPGGAGSANPVPGSLVDRRGPVVFARAQAIKSTSRQRGLRPKLSKVGPPPMDASLANVAAAVRYPRAVKKVAACRRSSLYSIQIPQPYQT